MYTTTHDGREIMYEQLGGKGGRRRPKHGDSRRRRRDGWKGWRWRREWLCPVFWRISTAEACSRNEERIRCCGTPAACAPCHAPPRAAARARSHQPSGHKERAKKGRGRSFLRASGDGEGLQLVLPVLHPAWRGGPLVPGIGAAGPFGRAWGPLVSINLAIAYLGPFRLGSVHTQAAWFAVFFLKQQHLYACFLVLFNAQKILSMRGSMCNLYASAANSRNIRTASGNEATNRNFFMRRPARLAAGARGGPAPAAWAAPR